MDVGAVMLDEELSVVVLSTDVVSLALLLHDTVPNANAAIAAKLKNCFFISLKFVSLSKYKNETTAVVAIDDEQRH